MTDVQPTAPAAPDGGGPESAPQPSVPSVANVPRTVVSNRVDFSASLDAFQGPLDLLLYLLKENEVEITEIPIAKVFEQYVLFIEQASQMDLQLAGEFLVMAVTLMEIKSRELLPVQEHPEDAEEAIEDPRSELVRQLLEYRRLKDQARALELQAERWQCHHARGLADDIPEPANEQDSEAGRAALREALVDVDLFTLFAAYEKLMKAVAAVQPRNIVLDTESIEDRILRIERLLKARPFARFVELVLDLSNRADVAATFFALLELVRRRAIKLVQTEAFGSFDVEARDPQSAEQDNLLEQQAAEAEDRAALDEKARQEELAAQGVSVHGKFDFTRKRQQARAKFEGIVRPEDVEEIDAEEVEIGRRIDAILAAADAISERFEQSREGQVRNAPLDGEAPPASEPAPPAPEP